LLSIGALDFSHVDNGVLSGVLRFNGVRNGVTRKGVVLRALLTDEPKAEVGGWWSDAARLNLLLGGASTDGRRIGWAMRLTLLMGTK
jgi:hypothetical protein